MDGFTPEQALRAFGMTAGEISALRNVLAALIASHPKPDALHRLWHHSKPEWIDHAANGNLFRVPAYEDAFVQTLSAMTQLIDDAAQYHRPAAG